MAKKVVAAKVNIKNMTKNIAILCCFIICPIILSGLIGYENAHPFDPIRFIFENRVYGAVITPNQNKTHPKFAPDIHIGHEITIYPTIEFINWKVEQKSWAGTIPSEQISPIHAPEIAPALFFRYTYQFPFSVSTGFFLGTSTGFLFSWPSHKQFKAGYGIFFPTISGGFTASPVQSDRLALGIEYSGIWYPKMVIYTNSGIAKPLKATLDAWNFYIENDYFFTDHFSITAGSGMRLINNICQLNFVCSNTNYLNTLRIKNIEFYGQIGLLFGDVR